MHEKGSIYDSGDALLEAVTGQKMNPGLFLGYLRDKYTVLYDGA